MKIAKDRVAYFHYTLRDQAQETLDSSQGEEPLGYIHGHDNLIPGLEQALEGKQAGDSFEVTVEPAEAYGQRDEGLVETIEREQFEGIDEIEVGMRFRTESNGADRIVTVTEIQGDEVTIDANHPLAGEKLTFDVEVTEVRPSTDAERQHGHVHDGDHHH
ncbi:MAG TPA: peptidylprolyl isomerase [Anaerolineales bacterium]|jgi:FKBP-type peptidyl-prolyl cis-trans isomerase SlyD